MSVLSCGVEASAGWGSVLAALPHSTDWDRDFFRANMPCYPERPLSRKGTAIILGSGPNAWSEIMAAVTKTEPPRTIIALNLMGLELRAADMIVIGEAVIAKMVRDGRADNAMKPAPIHCTRPGHAKQFPHHVPAVDHWWPGAQGPGSASLMAIKIALAMGHDGALLAGCPLDDSGQVDSYPVKSRDWTPAKAGYIKSCRAGHIAFAAIAGDFVRSTSGWTRELYGGPDG